MEEKEREKAMKFRLYKDGRWDVLGEGIQLCGAYPAIDGIPVSPVRVLVESHTVLYQLEEGCVRLQFLEAEDLVEVRCTIQGLPKIHDIEPIANALAVNAKHAFVQGFGMGDWSGCVEIGKETSESNGLIALYHGESSLFAYVLDHRHYINRYCVGMAKSLFGEGAVRFSGGFRLEGTAEGTMELPSFFFMETPKLVAGLKSCAEKIASFMGARAVKPPAFYWCSWYYLYQNLDQGLLEEYVGGFRKAGIPFSHIQIDAGYAADLGDWLYPSHHFPEGLKKAARTVLDAGYEPGIWIGPFMVGDQSELFRRHPDWILRDLEGNPVTELKSYNEPKLWGSRDGNYYVLDTSHPQALAYLKEVFLTLKKWGFTLYKTDFMLWNMHDTSKVRRFNSRLTSVEIFRNTLKTIREAIGEDSYLLGCIAPFLPFIGYADGMRIAGDVGAQWAEDFGPVNMIRILAAEHYFNHVYWQNDPDSVLLREFDIDLKPHEIRSLALLQALSGGMVTASDPIHRIAKDRAELLRFIVPKDKAFPQYPYFTQMREEIVLIHRLPQGNLLFAMNPTERPVTVFYRFADFFDEGEWYVRQYGADGSGKSEMYAGVLPSHDSVLLFLTGRRLDQEPENLWEW